LPPPPRSPLFPYTTLFRSLGLPRVRVRHLPDDHPPGRERAAAGAAHARAADPLLPGPPGRALRPVRGDGGGLPAPLAAPGMTSRSEEHTSELQSPYDLVCR